MSKDEKNQEDKVYIRLDLEGVNAQRFKDLKKKLGLKSNTELVRFILAKEFERSFKQ